MRVFFNGTLVALTAAIAAVSSSAFAENAISSASVVEPVNVTGSREPVSTSIFVSGITGDLIIRIAGAIAAAAEDNELQPALAELEALMTNDFVLQRISGTDYGKVPEAGMLNGNPVSSIDLQTIYINETGQPGVSVILAYN